MKKNNTMRVAAGLAIAALLSTCLVSGTYAKYTTSKASDDTARVAKWGVKMNPSADAFATSYAKDDNSFTMAANTVVSADKVVAPGTKGSLTATTLSGTPEVAVRVTNKATLTLKNWTVASGEYCPIVITVNGTDYKCSDTVDVAQLETNVENAINGINADYEAGTNLATETAACPKVSWRWDFSGNDDAKDTELGDAGTAATIDLKVETTVTQID